MRQEDPVSVVLAGFRHYEAGDWAAFAAIVDPDVHVTGMPDWPEPGPWHDRESFIAQFSGLMEGFDSQRLTDLDVLAHEDEWVVVDWTWEAHGATSGFDAAFDMAAAFRVRGGRLVEAHYRWTKDEAFAITGLSPG